MDFIGVSDTVPYGLLLVGCVSALVTCSGVNCSVGCDFGCGVDCSVGCGVDCSVGCGVNCGVDCDVGRGVDCGVGCGVGCGFGCGVNCGVGCGVGCGAAREDAVKIEMMSATMPARTSMALALFSLFQSIRFISS